MRKQIESIAGNIALCELVKDEVKGRLNEMNTQQKVRAERLLHFLEQQSDLLIRLEEDHRRMAMEIEALKRIAL